MKYKNLELNNKLNDYNNIKTDFIKNIYIGSITLLVNTPICIYNINKENLPAVTLTLFEIGIIYISVSNIKKLINLSKETKEIKQNYSKEKNNINITNSYLTIENDLNKKIKFEDKKFKKKKLIKLKNNLTTLYK